MNPYEELEIDPSASAGAIKAAYRKATKTHHPDRATSEADRIIRHERMQRLNRAYEILTDPEKKKRFDSTGSPDPDPKRAAIERAMTVMLMEVVDSKDLPIGVDLFGVMRKVCEARERRLLTSIADIEQLIKKRKRVLKRIIRKDGGENFLAIAVAKDVAKKEEAIEALQQDIAFAKDLLREMDHFTLAEESQFGDLMLSMMNRETTLSREKS